MNGVAVSSNARKFLLTTLQLVAATVVKSSTRMCLISLTITVSNWCGRCKNVSVAQWRI